MDTFRKFTAYLLPVILPPTLQWLDYVLNHLPNPFPTGSLGSLMFPAVIGSFLAVIASLRIHPNGVNGAPAGNPDAKGRILGGPALVLLVGALFSMPAMAAEPTLGVSWKTNKLGVIAIGPTVGASLAGYNVRDDVLNFDKRLMPGAGIAIFTERPYALGVSGTLLISVNAQTEPARAAIILSLARYLTVGWSKDLLLFGLGVGPIIPPVTDPVVNPYK